MKEIHFDVDLTTKELFCFSMRHTYCSISGVFGLFISLGSWLICVMRYRELETSALAALIIIGFLFTVVQPLMLYSKAVTQKKRNDDIHEALHYCVHEEGITVSQGEQKVEIHWYDIRKQVQSASGVYLYMSPVRAFIFPKAQLGEQYETVCSMITERMEAYKDYEPEQEEEHDEQSDGE